MNPVPVRADDPPATAFAPARGDFRWEGVGVKEYKPSDHPNPDFNGITRQTLFGQRGERIGFEVRYFEIAPGGWSSLECHRHAHAVIGLRGEGNILLGNQARTLRFLDLAYIGPDQPHRLTNETSEPFGFLCIVDAERDRPRQVAPEDLPDLLSNPNLTQILTKR